MELQFFLGLNPPTVTHQMKKVTIIGGKPRFYEPPKLKEARAVLTAALAPHAPQQPVTGAVQLVVCWCFPLDKGRRHKDGEYRTTRPDTDNLQKLLKDCMTAVGFWQDDAQVCVEVVEKKWCERYGISVLVRDFNGMGHAPE